MSKQQLSQVILEILGQVEHPLRIREIEAHVVLKGCLDVTAYEIHQAVRDLEKEGHLRRTDDFRYSKAPSAA